MDISGSVAIAAPFTAGFETFSPSPYWDVNGYAIGYGNHYYEDGSAVGADDDPIDQPTALALMTFYLTQNANDLVPQLSVDQNDNQLAALIDIRYRCGTITTALLNLINSGADPGTISAQIEQTCITVNGVQDSGEMARALAEAGLYQSSASAGSGMVILAAVLIGLWALSK
jgi:GH24 family phage-related lysozyme (muramidase)